ncbi:hypothetical protein MOSE0_C03114 [Monosporozyma servazzii]
MFIYSYEKWQREVKVMLTCPCVIDRHLGVRREREREKERESSKFHNSFEIDGI